MRIINYWLKILSLNEMSPVKKIYNIALQLNKLENTRPASFWVENIKNILYKYGFGYVWENQNYVDDIIFIDQFKNLKENLKYDILCPQFSSVMINFPFLY